MMYKKIHFVGIKGVGMTPLAIIAKEAEIKVSGSDIDDEFITDEPLKHANIVPSIGFAKDHIKNVDLVITTGAHEGFSNVEVQEAKRKKIKVITQGQAVGKFMSGEIFGRLFIGISVAGTHGKTTTTAMIATILKENNFDPSYVVGTGFIPSLGLPGHFGKGKYFIAEADEYATEPNLDKTAKFLWQHPKIAIFTNIEFDHPDIYKSIDEIRKAFLRFANQLPKDGLLIACGDDPQVKLLLREHRGRRVTYGFSRENDFVISNVQYHHSDKSPNDDDLGILDAFTSFTCQNDAKKRHSGDERSEDSRISKYVQDDRKLGRIYLNIFGDHNALNATASIIASMEIGLNIEQIKSSLLKFTGTKRRSEYIGQLLSGALVFDDYAHHPTKIKATLSAFRKRFPKSKIVCIFQPHTYSRTKSLFEQFIKSFNDANIVVVTNIYASLREKADTTISSKDLVDRMRKFKKEVFFMPSFTDVVEYVNKMNFGEDTILITMGAGDVYKINEKLILRQAQEKN